MNIFIKIINIIKIKYSNKVIFVKSDKKRALEKKFANFIMKKDIIFETFTSDTSVQNDHIE